VSAAFVAQTEGVEMRSLIALSLCLLSLLAGCASFRPVTSGALKVLNWQAEVAELVPLDVLELPEDAELELAPLTLKVLPRGGHDEATRLQLLIRVRRNDGATVQWFVGADGRSTLGERGFRLAPGETLRSGFGGADYGPLRVSSIEAIEIALADAPLELSRHPRFVGLAALKDMVNIGAQGYQRLSDDGFSPLLAYALPVETNSEAEPGESIIRIAIVSTPEGEPASVFKVHGLKGARLLDAQGNSEEGLNLFLLELRVIVPEHR